MSHIQKRNEALSQKADEYLLIAELGANDRIEEKYHKLADELRHNIAGTAPVRSHPRRLLAALGLRWPSLHSAE
jgi:hypothetical protein